jgi:hypothetical protein
LTFHKRGRPLSPDIEHLQRFARPSRHINSQAGEQGITEQAVKGGHGKRGLQLIALPIQLCLHHNP